MKSSLAIVHVLARCAFLLCFSIAGSGNSDVLQWRRSDPSYVPFAVQAMAISSDNRFVALSVYEHPRKDGLPGGANALTTYVLDLTTGYHRRIGSRRYGLVAAQHGHTFLVYGSNEPPLLVDGLKTIRTLDVGDHLEGWLNPHTSSVIFQATWPGDRDGFNGVTIRDELTGNANRVHLHATTESLSFCPLTGHFFTQHWYSDDSKAGTDEYDAKGDFVKTAKQDRGVFSARCHYVLPFSALAVHGPDVDWGIYDATSGAQLQDFPWNEDGNHDLHSFIAWNPVYDHLLLMYSKKAETETDSIDVMDVRRGAVIKSWPGTDVSLPIVWSGDGSSVVTIRDRHVSFDKINPDNSL